jgi:RNA polymerase sigma-70 factor (ECF subfamily)
VDGIVALFTDDVWLTMPPVPLEYQGREPAAVFLATSAFRLHRTYRLVPTRANGQLAFGIYRQDPPTGVAHANGLLVLTLTGRRIRAIARFQNSVLPRFGLPPTLPN